MKTQNDLDPQIFGGKFDKIFILCKIKNSEIFNFIINLLINNDEIL